MVVAVAAMAEATSRATATVAGTVLRLLRLPTAADIIKAEAEAGMEEGTKGKGGISSHRHRAAMIVGTEAEAEAEAEGATAAAVTVVTGDTIGGMATIKGMATEVATVVEARGAVPKRIFNAYRIGSAAVSIDQYSV